MQAIVNDIDENNEEKVHGLHSAFSPTINCVKRSNFEIISNYISDNGRLTNANAS